MSYLNNKYDSVDDDTKRLPIGNALYKENDFRFKYYYYDYYRLYKNFAASINDGARLRLLLETRKNSTHRDCEFNYFTYR